MEHADEAGMRRYTDPNCHFVHIGVTCKLDKGIDKGIAFYTAHLSRVMHGSSCYAAF